MIDRFPRRQLFAYGLGLFTIIMIVLPVLPPIGKALPYANYLIVRIFEHLIYSFYYILVGDYFTVMDNKRYAGHFVSGMAAGGLIGGGLLTAMTSLAGPTVAALVTPALVASALVFASWTTKRQHPLDGLAYRLGEEQHVECGERTCGQSERQQPIFHGGPTVGTASSCAWSTRAPLSTSSVIR